MMCEGGKINIINRHMVYYGFDSVYEFKTRVPFTGLTHACSCTALLSLDLQISFVIV